MMTSEERILMGRNAELALKDDTYNRAFNLVVERAMIRMIRGTDEEALKEKSYINAIYDVRKAIKSMVEDGDLAQAELELNEDES
jgi:hypothetical protein